MDLELLQRVTEKRNADDLLGVDEDIAALVGVVRQKMVAGLRTYGIEGKRADAIAENVLNTQLAYRTLVGSTPGDRVLEYPQMIAEAVGSPRIAQQYIDKTEREINAVLQEVDKRAEARSSDSHAAA